MMFSREYRVSMSVTLGLLVAAGSLLAQQGTTAGGVSGATAQKAATQPVKATPVIADPGQVVVGSDGSIQSGSAKQSFTVQSDTQEEDDQTFVLKTTTRRVIVDVVVTGPDGAPVPDLDEKDFTVFEDRKIQEVKSFEEHSPDLDQNLFPPAPTHLAPNTFVNLEKTPASGPPAVILIDALNTAIADQMVAHQQIVNYLAHKADTTQVALFMLSDHLALLQGFTTDTDKLLSVMKTHAASPRLAAASEQEMRAQITLDAFIELGKFLAVQTGRKNLLWFSGSFDMMVLPKSQTMQSGLLQTEQVESIPNPGPGPVVTTDNLLSVAGASAGSGASSSGYVNSIADLTVLQDRLRKVAAELAASQTAIYPIDVRGLSTDPGESAATSTSSGISNTIPSNAQNHLDYLQSLGSEFSLMQEIADATGGQAFANTNGLAAAARKAVQQGASYYTLVYAPSNMKFDGGLRGIRVALDKPGYHLSYRSAYYAMDSSEVLPDDVQPGALSGLMVRGSAPSQELLFKAEIIPVGAPVAAPPESPLANKATWDNPKKRKPQHLSGMVQNYDIRLALMAQQLAFHPSEDGRQVGSLQIGVYGFAADGQKLGGTRQKLETLIPPRAYQRAKMQGLFHQIKVQLPVEASSLRLGVLDPESHHAGSIEVDLPLPTIAPPAAEAPHAAVPLPANIAAPLKTLQKPTTTERSTNP
jgi:VWFA-related protein